MKLPDEDTKIYIGYAFGFAVAFATFLCASKGGTDAPLQFSLCLLGGASGWALGILLSPIDDDETTKFGAMGKAAAALLSGYAVAKLEPAIVKQTENSLEGHGHLYSFRVALFLTMFVVGFLFPLISRLYGEDVKKRRERRQAQLLSRAEEILSKYQKLKSDA